MTKNRRNYYRILQIQPKAAPQVIKASYRTLMGTARLHPDLGGDHDAATRGAGPAGGQPAHDATSLGNPDPARWAIERRCPMCARALPAVIRADTRCDRCGSPLCVPPQPDSRNRELLGRRSGARSARAGKSLQQFLQHEAARHDHVIALQGVAQSADLRHRCLLVAAKGKRPDAGADEKRHLRDRSAL